LVEIGRVEDREDHESGSRKDPKIFSDKNEGEGNTTPEGKGGDSRGSKGEDVEAKDPDKKDGDFLIAFFTEKEETKDDDQSNREKGS